MYIGRVVENDKMFLITRKGKAKRDGGKGVEWICGCPYGRRRQPCRHLLFVFNNFFELPRKNNFIFMKDGRKFYRKLYNNKLMKITSLISLLDRR